jgi:eukaryotic-like serine/threonine-protein kinase
VSATQKLLRFGVFELNLDTEELRKSETVVKLSPQAFKLLALLVSHAGQVVSRDEIQKQLWGEETEVDFEHGVNKGIKQIRGVLGDNAEKPLYIETPPRHGYHFVAPVVSHTIPAARPKVVESESGEWNRGSLLAGSGAGAAAAVAAGYPAAARGAEVAITTEPAVARGGALRVRVWRILLRLTGAALVLVALVGGGLYWRTHKAPTLTEKDTIVLAEFDNKTGDAVFDGTLRQGLSAQLEQSPFLNLLSDQRIAQTLSLMAQPKDARLTGELARDVCQRTAGAAAIEESIASLGSQYVLGLKAVNCRNGDLLADEQVTANDKEHVIKALGAAATKLREKLGESLASVQKYDAPAENVTTSSLEALQAYSLGYQAQVVRDDSGAAIELFRRAISLDPSFAMAYARLGTCLFNSTRNPESAKGPMGVAYHLRERASERERFYIDTHYLKYVAQNLEAARQTCELWARIYPRDTNAYSNLNTLYAELGDYDMALAAAQQGLTLDPNSRLDYANVVDAYLLVNRSDEAKAKAQEAQARGLDSPRLHWLLYNVAFKRHDAAGMEQEAAALMGKPGWEGSILMTESYTAAYVGQFAKAREFTRRAIESLQRDRDGETVADYQAQAALREALVGNMGMAKQQAETALALSHGGNIDAVSDSAIALGLAGDSAQAVRLADDLARRFPENRVLQAEYLPEVYAAAALGRRKRAEALEALANVAHGPYYYPDYLRGEAYLALHQGSGATAEFQRILDHPGWVGVTRIGALPHLGLGRAYALSGETAKAKAAYEDFLTLWKDADPDIPIYKQAKAEYAKLQ